MKFSDIFENILQVKLVNGDCYDVLLTHKEHGVMIYMATPEDKSDIGKAIYEKCESLNLVEIPKEYQRMADDARDKRNERLHRLNEAASRVLESEGEEAFNDFENEYSDYREWLRDLPYSAEWPNVEWIEEPDFE